MADKSSTDLIMRFVMKGGEDVLAECVLDKDKDDTLMAGFEPSDYDTYSNFFEITNFDFGLEVSAEDSSSSALNTQRATGQYQSGAGSTQAHSRPSSPSFSGGFGGRPRVKSDEWSRWRSAVVPEDAKKIARKFQVEFQKMSFSRIIDRASPTFFSACCKSQPFDEAVLVKRVSRGERNNKSRLPVGYLRIEFKKVLITGVDWTDGDLVQEKIEFICQEMNIKMRTQTDDGEVTAQGERIVHWKRDEEAPA